MGALTAVSLVAEVANEGAMVCTDHWRWEEPIPCDVCGDSTAQTLYVVELSDGSTLTCGVRCASRLLGTTTDRVYCARPHRRGPLAAAPTAPPVSEVVR